MKISDFNPDCPGAAFKVMETNELFEDMAVPPGIFAATFIDSNKKGHTVQMDADSYFGIIKTIRDPLQNKSPEQRQDIYYCAVSNLINALGSSLPGADNASQLLSNILHSIICHPDEYLRCLLLDGINELFDRSGRAHLIGIWHENEGLVWVIAEGRVVRCAS